MEQFFPSFLIGIFVSVIFLFLSVGIHILFSLILPGRKGYLINEKSRSFPDSTEEEERQKYVHGLTKLGFIIDQNQEGLIKAHKPKSQEMKRFPNPCPLSFLPLALEMRFFSQIQELNVFLKLKMDTYVFSDTGEGKYLEALGDYVLSDEFDQSDPPIILFQQSAYPIMLILSLLALAVSLFHFLPLFPSDDFYWLILLHGLGSIYFLVNLFDARARYAARLYPRELLTSRLGLISRIISGAAFLLYIYNIHHRYEDFKIGTLIFYGIYSLLAGVIGRAISGLQENVLQAKKDEAKRDLAKQKQIPAKPIHADIVDGSTLRIPIPLQKQKSIVVFFSVWLIIWTLGEFAAAGVLLNQLLSFIRSGALSIGIFEVLFMSFWLTGWTIGGGFAIYTWLWSVTGAEILYLAQDVLRIEKKIAWTVKTNDYYIKDIRKFRKETDSSGFKMADTTLWCFAFEYYGKTVRIGRGVRDEDADPIEKIVRQRLARIE